MPNNFMIMVCSILDNKNNIFTVYSKVVDTIKSTVGSFVNKKTIYLQDVHLQVAIKIKSTVG